MVMRKIKKSHYIVIVLALVILALLFVPYTTKKIKLEDRCGPFVNMVSHTIQSKSICETRCKSQCETIDYKLSKAVFQENTNSCNDCMCYCKKTVL